MWRLHPLRLTAPALMVGYLGLLAPQGWAVSQGAEAAGAITPRPPGLSPEPSSPPSAPPSTMTSRLIEAPDNLRVELWAHRTSVLQALERQMTVRGQELLVQSLCRYTPVPGKRLVAALRGVQVIHSFEEEGRMELTLQVPRQTPVCEVRDVGATVLREGPLVTMPSLATGTPAPAAPLLAAPAVTSDAAAPTTVRRSKGEF
jgi:hypothetical protein